MVRITKYVTKMITINKNIQSKIVFMKMEEMESKIFKRKYQYIIINELGIKYFLLHSKNYYHIQYQVHQVYP